MVNIQIYGDDTMKSSAFSFEGWSPVEFIKGREKLIVAAVGFIATQLATANPMMAGMVAAGSELIYAVLKYFVTKR